MEENLLPHLILMLHEGADEILERGFERLI
jgi:hypothetical protein